jgi:hypothetical protein
LENRLIQVLESDPNGVRAELLVATPAILAGYACQAAAWASLVEGEGYPVDSVFLRMTGADGREYPYSDAIDELLVEGRYSVWSLVAGAIRELTDRPLPDVEDIAKHTVENLGGPGFAQPRLPEGLSLGADQPLALIQAAWPRFLSLLGICCVLPEEWPVLFGTAVQRTIATAAEVLDPIDACVIAMECAIPMAHLPLRRVLATQATAGPA